MERLSRSVETILLPICQSTEVAGLSFAIHTPRRESVLFSYGCTKSSCLEPVLETTSFQLASVSKFVTACLVLELVQQGVFTLKQSITSDILKIWPESSAIFQNSEQITWAHLLSHRAGFVDRGGLLGVDTDQASLVEPSAWRSEPFRFHSINRIGHYHYSACGFWLIQCLLSDQLGLDFPQLLEQYLFAPLQMINSFADQSAAVHHQLASGHVGELSLPSSYMRFPDCEAVAGIWSSASDLRLLMAHLLRSKRAVIRGGSLVGSVMFSDLLAAPFPGPYRLGVQEYRHQNDRFYGHTGLNLGFSSGLILDNALASGAAFLINDEVSASTMNSFLKLGYLLMRYYAQEDSS